MNIAFVTQRLLIGGVETYIINRAQAHIDRGHKVIVLSQGGCNVKNLPEGVKHFLVRNIMIPPYMLTNNERKQLYYEITEILKKENIEIIETNSVWPFIHISNSFSLHKIPFYYNVLSELDFRHNRILQQLTKRLSKHGLYFTLTSKMNEYIEDKCNAVLSANIINIPIKKMELSEAFGDYILSVCRMSPEKMYVRYLIEGYDKYLQKHPNSDYRLIIVGDGPLFSDIQKLANEVNEKYNKNKVILKGYLSGKELFSLYANCLMYIGMGTTLLIAAAYGKASVIPGFEMPVMKYSWGFWGDNPEKDINQIVHSISDTGNPVKYDELLEKTLDDVSVVKEKGKKAKSLFNSELAEDIIYEKWEKAIIQTYSNFDFKKVGRICAYSKFYQMIFSVFYFLYSIIKYRFLKRSRNILIREYSNSSTEN